MRQFRSGDLVKHFKRELVGAEAEPTAYLYEIIGEATHSETREPLMIYKALYGDGGLYARPLAMFLEPVDKVKYPTVQQAYRFELVEVAHDN